MSLERSAENQMGLVPPFAMRRPRQCWSQGLIGRSDTAKSQEYPQLGSQSTLALRKSGSEESG
jgi:hypothetical protein